MVKSLKLARVLLVITAVAVGSVAPRLFSAHASANDRPIVLTTHNLAPYGSYQDDGSFDGIAVRVVACVLEMMNRPVEIRVMPWKRAQLEVINGTADGFFAGSRNARRDAYAQATAVIARQTWTWYLLKDHTGDPKSDEFKSQAVVSSFLGANMQLWLETNNFQTTQSPPPTTKHLLDMLLAKRFDAVLANNLVMALHLRKQDALDEVRAVVQKDKPLSVYFSNTFLGPNPGFMEKFNAAVPACRKEIEDLTF